MGGSPCKPPAPAGCYCSKPPPPDVRRRRSNTKHPPPNLLISRCRRAFTLVRHAFDPPRLHQISALKASGFPGLFLCLGGGIGARSKSCSKPAVASSRVLASLH